MESSIDDREGGVDGNPFQASTDDIQFEEKLKDMFKENNPINKIV
jgi:hypothetical protein